MNILQWVKQIIMEKEFGELHEHLKKHAYFEGKWMLNQQLSYFPLTIQTLVASCSVQNLMIIFNMCLNNARKLIFLTFMLSCGFLIYFGQSAV